MEKLKQLIELEKDNYQQIKRFVKSSLLSIDDIDQLPSQLPKLSKDLQVKIKDLRKASQELADEHSEEVHRDQQNRKLIIAVAALSLYRSVGSALVSKEAMSYSAAVKEAMDETDPILQRLNTTETFDAYNQKYIANWSQTPGYYLWSAVLDAKTCPYCEDLDGKKFEDESDVPDFHINCRCTLDFIKE